ncbi:MAG: hypothetical protein SH821_09975 [Phototrophicales bacterium]|nr:hypothetical protein [Phototrophicales bacterium]
MGIRIQWDDENTKLALHYIYEGMWMWEENYQAIDDSIAYFDSEDYVVNLIIDMTRSSGYPAGNILSHFRNMAERYSEKAGHNVVINNNPFTRMMSDTFNKIYKPKKIKGKSFFVKDLTEARATLERLRKIRNEVEKGS